MKEFNIEEILLYSEKIEKESYSFYTHAGEKVNDPEVRDLLKTLASEEVTHVNNVRELLLKKDLKPSDSELIISVEKSLAERLVNTALIDDDATPLAVLEVALEREQNTENLYATISAFTDLPSDVVSLFDALKEQEQIHAERIRRKMKHFQ